ncbi:hypothetical protein KJ940_02915, partial [Myxococcota bacterium]|nr:hypothetical protein [Myxococcota bacterium]
GGGGGEVIGGGGGEGNGRPELSRIGDRQASVGAPLTIQLEAHDPDDDPLTFSIRSNLPDGATFDKEAARFDWTPSAAQEGGLIFLTFEVSDGALQDRETLRVSVAAAGAVTASAPIIEPIGDQALVAEAPFELKLIATDPNGDAITWQMLAEGLVGAALDAEGRFTWTPPLSAAGQRFEVTFIASDGALKAQETVHLSVQDPSGGGVNAPPTLAPIPDQEIPVGVPFTQDVGAVDEDPDALIFGVVGALPAGAQFDAAAARLSWTPAVAQAGQAFPIIFEVSDGEFRAIERVVYTVLSGPQPGCTPDVHEGQEPIPLVANTPLRDLSICGVDDTDTFTFELAAAQPFSLAVLFQHASGDLDAQIQGPMGPLAYSDSSDDGEFISTVAPVAGVYQAVIYGYDGVTNPAYEIQLIIEDTPPPACVADLMEPNDAPEQARVLLVPEIYEGLTSCGDEDWYTIGVAEDQRLIAYIGFERARAPVELYASAIPAPGLSLSEAPLEACLEGAARCLQLSAPGRQAMHLLIGGSTPAQGYSLYLDLEPLAPPPPPEGCDPPCAEDQVCDYATSACVDIFCDMAQDSCPRDYLCYQEWCVDLCQDDGGCLNAGHVCKQLDELPLCGPPGVAPVGAACADFTDCAGDLDCFSHAPGGLCSRICAVDADCGGGICGVMLGAPRCLGGCATPCREGYACAQTLAPDGATVEACIPQ